MRSCPSPTCLHSALQCSFLPKFSIHIETKYEDNKGSNDNVSGAVLLISLSACFGFFKWMRQRKLSPYYLPVFLICWFVRINAFSLFGCCCIIAASFHLIWSGLYFLSSHFNLFNKCMNCTSPQSVLFTECCLHRLRANVPLTPLFIGLLWSGATHLVLLGGGGNDFPLTDKSVRVTCGGLAFKTVHADNKLEKI